MWYVKKFKAQTYCLFMEIILCFEKMLKISTVLAVADLFTFVNKSWNDPLNLLWFSKYWTQMKGLTLSFLFCSCSKLFHQKHGLQIKIKIWFLGKNTTFAMRPLVAKYAKQNRTRYSRRSILVFGFLILVDRIKSYDQKTNFYLHTRTYWIWKLVFRS